MEKVCEYWDCNNEFKYSPSQNRRYCSQECGNLARRGQPFSEEHRRKIGLAQKGKPRLYARKSIEQAFWEKIEKTDSCWNWTGAKDSNGYGIIRRDKKAYNTHRLSYQYNVGPIPEGLLVCHTCDNTICVNPEHLYVGTDKDNTRDKISRRRLPTKLTWEKACEIRRRFSEGNTTYTNLGIEYGVSRSNISLIVNNKHWDPDKYDLAMLTETGPANV